MDIVIFGTGDFYQRYKACFRNVHIIGLLDNDPAKQGTCIDGALVYAPAQGVKLAFQQVWLLSAKAAEMREQLLTLGVPSSRLFDIWDFARGLGRRLVAPPGMLCMPDGRRREALPSDTQSKIVILTPNLMLNGAEVALVQMVRTLLALGYNPLVGTLWDGPLREELLSLGVPVIMMGSIAHEMPLSSIKYLSGVSAYILNTIEMYLLLEARDRSKPVIWWLHDSEMVYQETHILDIPLRRLDLRGVDIYAVSPLAASAFMSHYGKVVSMGALPFGLQDWQSRYGQCNTRSHALTFSVVGSLSRIKSQSDFIRAVLLLPNQMRQSCRFYIIGTTGNQEFAEELYAQARGVPEIKFLGELGREELLRFYAEELDVLVCPSQSDTLPIVTVEAMMFFRPVIVSTGVGTAQMLAEGKAGAVVSVGDAESLAKAMLWMHEHPQARLEMGKQARKIYETKFTLADFQERVQKLMSETLNTKSIFVPWG